MTALRNLGRHMAMTLSSASAVAVTLTLMTLFLVLAANMNSFADHVDNMEGIEKAQYGGESIQDMIDTFETIRYGGAVFILALGVLAIFLITNTIKMTIYKGRQKFPLCET